MRSSKKEKLMVELTGAFYQLRKKAFENLRFSFKSKNLKNKNLSPIHWRLLCLLQEKGKKHPGELADELGISRSAVSQYVNSLLKERLVTMEVDKEDRRLRYVKLAAKGEAFLNNSREKITQAFESLFADLTEKEIETLLKIFRKILS